MPPPPPPPPQPQRFASPDALSPRAAPTAMALGAADDAEFAMRKKEFEDAPEYATPIGFLGISMDQRLKLINAAAAYARGATGAGEIVAVTDTGIRDSHREFWVRDKDGVVTGNKATVTTFGEGLFGDLVYKPTGDQLRHGTAVAALIAGARDGEDVRKNMHGVAFGASLFFRQFRLGSGSGNYKPLNLSTYNENDDIYSAGILDPAFARIAGASIINYSFGIAGVSDRYDPAEIKKRFRHTAEALAQAHIAPADRVIVVMSGGNANGKTYPNGATVQATSVELWPGLGAHFPELQGHVLAVVAVGQGGEIASFSNRCGIAKAFCLAAPGVGLNTAGWDGDANYRTFSGTSAAAPMVSGSLAVMRQFFKRQLGNTELVTRLLATANRTERYADSDIYGHGLVDLDAATAPMGALMTSLSGDPLARPFTGGGFAQNGGAFGAAMQNGLDGVEIAAFDQLNAPFFFPVANGIAHAPRISAAYDTNLREHEIALGGGVSQSASLSLMTDGGELASARIRRGDWWFSYGHHGGREAGLYLSGGGGNGAGGIGAGSALIGGIGMGGGIGVGGFGMGSALIGGFGVGGDIGMGGIGAGGGIGIGGGIGNGGAGGGIGNIGMGGNVRASGIGIGIGGNVGGIGGGGIGNTGGGIGMGGGIGTGGTGNGGAGGETGMGGIGNIGMGGNLRASGIGIGGNVGGIGGDGIGIGAGIGIRASRNIRANSASGGIGGIGMGGMTGVTDATGALIGGISARHFHEPLAFASPYLSLVRDGPGFGWANQTRDGARFGFSLMHGAPQFDHFANPGGARGLGALFDYRPNGAAFSLQVGAVREADGFLGARAQGNFGQIGADTAFAGIGGDWAAPGEW
ncbi:MAG: S8 family serine peptidase, partial [Gammaproteobacteria bacterium]